MATDEDPKALTRKELAKFLPSQRAIRAFERLFDLVPTDLISLQSQVNEASLDANSGIAMAQQALGALERIAGVLEELALMPPEVDQEDGDISPPAELSQGESLGIDPLVDVVRYIGHLQDVDDTGKAANYLFVYNATTGRWTALGAIDVAVTDNTTNLIASSATMTNGAAAAIGTLNNAPVAGDPSKWVPVDDNGTTRYAPLW